MDIDHGKCSHEHPPKIKIYIFIVDKSGLLVKTYFLKKAFNIYDHLRNIFATIFFCLAFIWFYSYYLFFFILTIIVKRIAQLYFKIFIQCTLISSFY